MPSAQGGCKKLPRADWIAPHGRERRRSVLPEQVTPSSVFTDDFIKGVEHAKLAPAFARRDRHFWRDRLGLSRRHSDRAQQVDAQAIAAYLKSLPPVKNAVPGPFEPTDVPSTLVSVVVPGDVYAKMPAPK